MMKRARLGVGNRGVPAKEFRHGAPTMSNQVIVCAGKYRSHGMLMRSSSALLSALARSLAREKVYFVRDNRSVTTTSLPSPPTTTTTTMSGLRDHTRIILLRNNIMPLVLLIIREPAGEQLLGPGLGDGGENVCTSAEEIYLHLMKQPTS